MTNIIKADDGISSGQTGIVSTADTSGTLELQATSGLVTLQNVTGSITIPKGTTAQRPATPTTGMIRYNTSISNIETYNGTSWVSVVASTSITSVTSITYSGDDLAVDITNPLPITITGANFEANSLVYVDTISAANAATSLTYSGTTQITCTPPAKSAASYNLWIVGPSGRLTVLANGLLYSGTPNWSGQSTSLTSASTAVSIQLSAAGDTPLVYTLVSGTLPTGVTLNSSGLISGTATGLTQATTFSNLVIRASDPQNQDASITINLTVQVQMQISRSLRFNRADQAHLSRTPGSASNRKTWTWSGWVKRGQTTANPSQSIFTAGSAAVTGFQFLQQTDTIELYNYSGGYTFQLITTPVYRDPSAWYHIVVAFDTTQATQSNRLKLYVNETQVTNFSTSNYPAQNTDYSINDSVATYIGRYGGGAGYELDGYITEINFIDGQQLTPASFGQTNATTGVWEPKAFSGTYGTNGFYLNFSDNSNTTSTTLGKDYSGNGNNWTPNNFSVTAGAGNDSLVDSPTSYGTDTGLGGEVRGNYCVFSTIDKSVNVAVSNGGLDLVGNNSGGRARATMAVSSGKWYFEFLMVNTSNGGACGFMSTAARSDLTGSGSTTDLGVNADTWGVLTNGTVKNNGTNGTSVSSISSGQIGMFALDMDSGKFWYGVNGTWSNSGNPVTGANPVYSNLSGYTIAPGIGHGVTTVISYSYNFGQRPFAYTAPSGFKALCTQNLSTPAVVKGSSYFNTVLYTGNGSTQSITGVGFQPDFTWIKSRTNTYFHALVDSARGNNNLLYTNATNAESGSGFGNIIQLSSNGFNLTYNSSFSVTSHNHNSDSLVAWNWRANGTGVTNTAGTITSTVSANQTSGFSIVSYTGNGSATATVGHGLGTVPAMFIVKSRSDATDWIVYHKSLGNGTIIKLNSNGTTFSTAYWQNTTPSSTLLYLNGAVDTEVCGNGRTFVAYCFAEVSGYSAFGSYTGNGSTDGPFIYLGFRPRWIMLKSSSTGGASGYDWIIQDTSRAPINLADTKLIANNSATENTDSGGSSTSGFGYDILSNGFKLRNSGGGQNGSGVTYIYAAFAENPFKYSLAR